MRLAVVAYIVPFVLVYQPALVMQGSVHEIVVVQKVHDEVSKYQLYNLDTEVLLQWASSAEDGTELTLHFAGDLQGGEYVLVVPSSGMFGGESLNYFRVL